MGKDELPRVNQPNVRWANKKGTNNGCSRYRGRMIRERTREQRCHPYFDTNAMWDASVQQTAKELQEWYDENVVSTTTGIDTDA